MNRTMLALTIVSLLTACGDADGSSGQAGQDGAPITVVAGFYPIAEAASRVGGEEVEVVNLTPAGTEPHDLELTPRQVGQLEDAEVVLYLGQGFQPAVEAVVARRDGLSIDLLERLPLDKATGEDHGHDADEDDAHEEDDDAHGDGLDPHFWLDPVRFGQAVGQIEEALADLRPGRADELAERADAYRTELDELDGDFESTLATCERDTVVVAHAAFHYLTGRYGLHQEAIVGLSPDAEADPRRLAELATLVEEEGVTTVFSETLVSPRVAETLAREADVVTDVLNPIEGLTPDEVEAGGTYISVMRDNLEALRVALGCR